MVHCVGVPIFSYNVNVTLKQSLKLLDYSGELSDSDEENLTCFRGPRDSELPF